MNDMTKLYIAPMRLSVMPKPSALAVLLSDSWSDRSSRSVNSRASATLLTK